MAQEIRVVVVEDQALVRAGLCSLLAQEKDLVVAGETGDGREALALAEQQNADVVLVDYFLKTQLEGAQLITQLAREHPRHFKVLCVSLHSEEVVGERALRAGARGFLCKDQTPRQLADAVRQVASGNYHVSDGLLSRISDGLTGNSPLPDGFDRLTERELHIIRLLGSGESVETIAARLGILPRTVATHRETLKRKLDIRDDVLLQARAQDWVARGALDAFRRHQT